MPSTTTEFIVFLIDDNPVILKALARLLGAAGYRTKAYQSAKAFLAEHDASIAGCAVLDHTMPGLNGLDVQETLARRGIYRPVIFLTGRGTIAESVKAMKAGAVDYLTKPIDKVDLLNAIRSAEERDKTHRDVEARNKVVLQRLAKLTPRERETLDLVTKGLLNKQIAGVMGATERTIKEHRGRVFKKMGAKTLAELVRMTAEYF
ncbi:MAG TPA: response regulator [Pseudolabrys sp.]|nr:response regulator [Pseudolabrys sp.]